MKGFHFGFPIEINGKVYYMDLNREGVQERIRKGYEQVQAEVEKVKETGNADIDIFKNMAREYIDAALGEGSYDSIFAGRDFSYYDIGAVYNYIAEAANDAVKKIRKVKK